MDDDVIKLKRKGTWKENITPRKRPSTGILNGSRRNLPEPRSPENQDLYELEPYTDLEEGKLFSALRQSRTFLDSPGNQNSRTFLDSPGNRDSRTFPDSPKNRDSRTFLDSPGNRDSRTFSDPLSPVRGQLLSHTFNGKYQNSRIGFKSYKIIKWLRPQWINSLRY